MRLSESISCTLTVLLFVQILYGAADPMLSPGFAADPSAKTLAEFKAAERRKIPLEVYIKAAEHYEAGEGIEVTVIVTNLFVNPLLMNSRLLVNHPRLPGELSFEIMGPDGKAVNIQTLVTPLTVREEDFVILERGESMQRSIDLADIFGVSHKGQYRVRACYRNEIDHMAEGRKSWKGRVWSEPIEFQLQ